MSGAVNGVFHAGITVSDMEATLRFYRDGLGLEVSTDGFTGGPSAERIWAIPVDRVRVVFLRVPGSDTLIELFEFEGIERHGASARPCDPGAGHLCLYVDDAVAVHQRIAELGFRSRSGEVITIESGRHAGARVAYLIDPDGYHVEVYELPAGV
jgi:catechol 2,3-dioxygenase-like lactoylglutathione lyase family enzyme